jgi:hypothetical protein
MERIRVFVGGDQLGEILQGQTPVAAFPEVDAALGSSDTLGHLPNWQHGCLQLGKQELGQRPFHDLGSLSSGQMIWRAIPKLPPAVF